MWMRLRVHLRGLLISTLETIKPRHCCIPEYSGRLGMGQTPLPDREKWERKDQQDPGEPKPDWWASSTSQGGLRAAAKFFHPEGKLLKQEGTQL